MRRGGGIAMTGAAGVVASVLAPALEEPIIGIDVRPQPEGLDVAEWYRGSVTDEALMSEALAGCSTVIYLATGGLDWADLLEVDVKGLKVVGDAMHRAGATKLVYASTNHVVGQFEREALRTGDHDLCRPEDPVRPDSMYGVAKAFGEAYCRHLAETTAVKASCIRIGTVRAIDDIEACAAEAQFDYIPGGRAGVVERLRRTWLFHEDLVRMMREEIAAPERFRLRFGVSDNERAFWARYVMTWND